MSEAVELLKKQTVLFEELKTRQDDFEANLTKIGEDVKGQKDTGVEQMNEKLGKMDDALASLDKIEKSAKARLELESKMSKDVQGRKETEEFLMNLRKTIGRNPESMGFNTEEFISVKELKNHVSGNTADGGIFIKPFLDSQIDSLIREFSPIRSIASVINISTDSYNRVIRKKNNGALRKGAMANFTAETKKDNFGDLVIKVDDLYAIALYEANLLNDSMFNLVADLLMSISEDFSITEATEFATNATGEGLRGILTYAHSTTDAFDTIEQITSAGSGALVFDDFIDTQAQLKNSYSLNASWMMNRLTKAVVRKLKDSEGQYLWSPSLTAGAPSSILGSPLIEVFEMPDVASSSLSVAYGDVRSAYQIVDRSGIEVTRDNLTQYPDVKYIAKKRSGGGLMKGQAMKILKTQA